MSSDIILHLLLSYNIAISMAIAFVTPSSPSVLQSPTKNTTLTLPHANQSNLQLDLWPGSPFSFNLGWNILVVFRQTWPQMGGLGYQDQVTIGIEEIRQKSENFVDETVDYYHDSSGPLMFDPRISRYPPILKQQLTALLAILQRLIILFEPATVPGRLVFDFNDIGVFHLFVSLG